MLVQLAAVAYRGRREIERSPEQCIRLLLQDRRRVWSNGLRILLQDRRRVWSNGLRTAGHVSFDADRLVVALLRSI